MKQLIIICFMCINTIVAQQKSSITVIGESTKTIEIKNYKINIEFREIVADGYQNIKSQNLEELKKAYTNMLNDIGINFEKFEENPTYRITSGQYTTTMYYFYVASSIEEAQKIVSQKMKGVTNTWIDIIAKEKTNSEIGALNKIAINDARDKAILIASNTNKKVGEILQIEDVNYKQQAYYPSKAQESAKYYIKVTFALE
ncbi:SIMPL domain-containing protein [Aquimarina sp. 2201CG5-10]|uniref:SIMPL domain-containing protein n=1 Tax=Aquimarina callyspongiae TaxID=3098150 RepID=UPI002AB514E7|nr:SIMPL domain-containing protein [Aquimarina sp. 2201CG5-10]MDY8135102.1 SIMPL domain-containing protein [Aquimarina sp. 2201CG5-10]